MSSTQNQVGLRGNKLLIVLISLLPKYLPVQKYNIVNGLPTYSKLPVSQIPEINNREGTQMSHWSRKKKTVLNSNRTSN